MTVPENYVIRGGLEGRERLRLMSRVLAPGTEALLSRAHIPPDARCVDVACGGGDVTKILARHVAPGGSVIGIDRDADIVAIARAEAAADGVANVRFEAVDLQQWTPPEPVDIVYARFILTHVSNPDAIAKRFFGWLRRGGRVIVEDIDYRGCFVFPDSEAFRRSCQLYCEVARRNGGDPEIGAKLPHILKGAGFEDISVSINQPVATDGDVKLIQHVTLLRTADAIVQASLATRAEIDALSADLYTISTDGESLMALPRIVQVSASR